MPLRRLVALAVPAAIGTAAFLGAKGISALVATELLVAPVVPSIAEAKAAPVPERSRVAAPILRRNPFDHVTGSLEPVDTPPPNPAEPSEVPPCAGVRSLVVVRGEKQEGSMAAFDVGGKRIVQRVGGTVGDGMRVAFVGDQRVWLEKDGSFCHASLGAPKAKSDGPIAGEPPKPQPPMGALEASVANKIVKTGPNEYAIDRASLDRLVEAFAELRKPGAVVEKNGDAKVGTRLVGVRPGTISAMLGLESGDVVQSINGFDTTNPEQMLELYARLRGGADRFAIRLQRAGKPTQLDYLVR